MTWLPLLLALTAVASAAPQQRGNYYNDERRGGSFNGVDSSFGSTLQRPPPINDLPIFDPYSPEKAPEVPIKLGERRCDNIYHGLILPCLLRPELPPFSYSTESMYNTEYKKKK